MKPSRTSVRNRATIMIAALFFFTALSCSAAKTLHGPITIDASRHNRKIRAALEFLETNEPAIHSLARRHIKTISWKNDPFWSFSIFPDHVTLSSAAMNRGTQHMASVIYHELNHIMMYKLRRPGTEFRDHPEIIEHYRVHENLTAEKIITLSRMEEEKLIHGIQYRFLIKHGEHGNAALVKAVLEDIEETYRHLKR